MDTRTALDQNTILVDDEHGLSYLIKHEIARGGSCIVYDAVYRMDDGSEKAVRLKECYPFHVDLKRENDGVLIPTLDAKIPFEREKQNLRNAFREGNRLFMTKGLTNATANMLRCFEKNNTIYIPSVYLEGETLSVDTFSTLKDCIRIIITLSQVVAQIHQAGYLYLDIKPENIFVITNAEGTGATELLQLFDFDSLLEVERLKTDETVHMGLSFSQGYAALEQQMGSFQKLGYYTDVYSVGAVLFYLIFGKPPRAMDCEAEAEYDFARSKYTDSGYQDRLFYGLTQFFHKALASYRFDRYQTMDEVIQKLKELAQLADRTVPYLCSTQLVPQRQFVGREKELVRLWQWLNEKGDPCLFVTGMGGIGKSSFIRKFISIHREALDAVVYLYFCGCMEDTIVDDVQLQVNTIEHREEEDRTAYFYRKIRAIRKLTESKRVLLVLDDFHGEVTKEFFDVLHAGWKVLVISRSCPPSEHYRQISIRELDTFEEQLRLFQNYLGRLVRGSEKNAFAQIVEKVKGHTLTLELLAKQIRKSQITIMEAQRRIEGFGFADMALEKVSYEKDRERHSDTIRNLISVVFSFRQQSMEKHRVMKALSLFNQPGISIPLFCEMLGLQSKDSIFELYEEGWIVLCEERLSMHPVIRESVEGWEWRQEYQQDAKSMFQYLCTRVQQQVETMQDVHSQKTDVKEVRQWTQLSAEVLENGTRQPELREEEAFRNLFGMTLLFMPIEHETFILTYIEEVIHMLPAEKRSVIMGLYKRWVSIYLEHKNLDRAWEVLAEIKKFVRGAHPSVKAQYFDVLADFYDARLNGAYDCDNAHHDLKKMKKAIDQAIFYRRLSKEGRSSSALCTYMLEKANVCIRSTPKKQREIEDIFKRAERLLERQTYQHPKLLRDYYLSKAWYYTLVCPDAKSVERLCQLANELAEKTCVTELEYIDVLCVPYANMMAELGRLDKAKEILTGAIERCETYPDLIPYTRKKLELCGYLLDVCKWDED